MLQRTNLFFFSRQKGGKGLMLNIRITKVVYVCCECACMMRLFRAHVCACVRVRICMENAKYFETNIQLYPQYSSYTLLPAINGELNRESFIQSISNIHTVSQMSCHKKSLLFRAYSYRYASCLRYLCIVIVDC